MKKELISYKNPKSPISETFKTLRTNIQFMNTSKKMKTSASLSLPSALMNIQSHITHSEPTDHS